MAETKQHPAVLESLGSPIEEGFFIIGNMNVSGSSGEADLRIPISGPRGKATIYAESVKSAGKWTIMFLEMEIRDTGERINLLE